jgi:hypothetical protein
MEAAKTSYALDRLIHEQVVPLLDLPDIVTEKVGLPEQDADYYAAAIAKVFALSNEFQDDAERRKLEDGIQWAIQKAENDFAFSAPVGEPTLYVCAGDSRKACNENVDCGANGPCQPQAEPFITEPPEHEIPIGQAFCWEKRQGNRRQDSVRSNLSGQEIIDLYERGRTSRGKRYAALKEGAGIGFLLPYSMLGEPITDLWPAWDNYLPVCFTLPVVSAKSSISLPDKCRFWFPTYPIDRFERACSGGPYGGVECLNDQDCGGSYQCIESRNDSPERARRLTWGRHRELSTDKATNVRYWDNYAIFASHSGGVRYIYPESDYDFYYFDNPSLDDVRIILKYELMQKGMFKHVYLDGKEGVHDSFQPCGGPEPCQRQVSAFASGKARHTIMVTGDVGAYEITIERATGP